jgi:hypothetical protein
MDFMDYKEKKPSLEKKQKAVIRTTDKEDVAILLTDQD